MVAETRRWIGTHWAAGSYKRTWGMDLVCTSEVEGLEGRHLTNTHELMETVTIEDADHNRQLTIGRVGEQLLSKEKWGGEDGPWIMVAKYCDVDAIGSVLEFLQMCPIDADIDSQDALYHLTNKHSLIVEPNQRRVIVGKNNAFYAKLEENTSDKQNTLVRYNYEEPLGQTYKGDYTRNMTSVAIKINGKELSNDVKELIYQYTTDHENTSGAKLRGNIKTNLAHIDGLCSSKIIKKLKESGLSEQESEDVMTALKEPSVIAGIIIGGTQETITRICNEVKEDAEYNAESDTFQIDTQKHWIIRENRIENTGRRAITVKTNHGETGETTGATIEHTMITGATIRGVAEYDVHGYGGRDPDVPCILRVSTITTVNN
ncbi:hypothetical protein OD632_005511, partial [Salmonella enterica]|nr:hypothetical protein [Salmonella enterica]